MLGGIFEDSYPGIPTYLLDAMGTIAARKISRTDPRESSHHGVELNPHIEDEPRLMSTDDFSRKFCLLRVI